MAFDCRLLDKWKMGLLLPQRPVLRPRQWSLLDRISSPLKLYIVEVPALASVRVAAFSDEVPGKFTIAVFACTFVEAEQGKLNLWVTWVAVDLRYDWTESGAKKICIALKRLEEEIILEHGVVSECCFDQMACIVAAVLLDFNAEPVGRKHTAHAYPSN